MANRIAAPYILLMTGTCLSVLLFSCSPKSTPQAADQPVAVTPSFTPVAALPAVESLPMSEVDIPVTFDLKSFYAMVERSIDKEYTSPGFPNDFVVADCQTRYMYRLRRDPLKFHGDRNIVGMAFMGHYLIAGAQRICSGTGSDRTAVSPWSPTCTCGVKEGERRVNVGFAIGFDLTDDLHIRTKFTSIQPVPLDKCTVCFWSQDITPTVMTQIKAQVDEAGRQVADSLAKLDLRPRFQQLWDQLNQAQPLFGMGWLQLNPERMRLSRFSISRDTLRLTMGLSARPVITQEMPQPLRTVVPDLDDRQEHNGFRVVFDARLRYDSLSAMATQRLKDKRIDIESVNRHVIIRQVDLSGSDDGRLGIRVRFDGSASGTFLLSGVPTYDSISKVLHFTDLKYDIRSKDVGVTTALWVFNRKVLNMLEQNTRFEMAPYEQQVMDMVNPQLNRELRKGVVLTGKLAGVGIPAIRAAHDVLTVRCMAQGDLSLLVKELPL